MKIYERYMTRILVQSTLLALTVLLAIFAFFSLFDQLEETGRGNYGVLQALEYVLLTLPHLAYELFPIACVIGSMATLGQLSHHSELAVLRTSGIARGSLILALCKGGLVLVLIAIVIGELIAPKAEQTAQHRRSVALTEQIALKTKYGFWSRDGQSFINIRKVLPGDRVEDIYIYEFDIDNELRASTFAKSAEYIDGQWILQEMEQTRITEQGLVRREMQLASWDSLLNPDVINLVVIKPQYLSFWGLLEYIAYLKHNDQNSLLYEQALWFKISRPFAMLLMVLMAVPLVGSGKRTISVGKRIMSGCVIGILFYIITQVSGNLGVVYQLNPVISIFMPLVLFGLFLVVAMTRQHS